MRPALKAGLLAVWRNRDTVQIGVDPRRAVALTGMREAAGLLGLLDGSRDHAQVLSAARSLGIPPAAADRVIGLLAAGGALCDFPSGTHRALPQGLRGRLAPELATAALAYGDADGGARVLARRRQACVRIHGTSRTGLWIASLLGTAGIGQVVTTGQVMPGEAPGQATAVGSCLRPDLVILADCYHRDLPTALLADRIPHLAASASEAIGVVGPLVLPGRSACLRCLDLARAELDPAWPLILAQLAGGAADPPACDAVLAAAVSAQAAWAALTFIDRTDSPGAAVNGTLELVLPDWRWRRRTWPTHPRCGCGRGITGDRQ